MATARNCPACGTPMARGYALVKKLEWGAQQTPVEAWVCRAAGCGLGKFIGNVLTTTRGLKKLNLKQRRKAMAENGETTKRWHKDYDACVECGTTEKRHAARGLCKNCYNRSLRVKAGAKARGPRKPKAEGDRRGGDRTVALTVYVPQEVYAALVAVGKFHETSPAELVAELVAKRFEGAKA